MTIPKTQRKVKQKNKENEEKSKGYEKKDKK